MKTFRQFLDEALTSSVVKAAARQKYTSKAISKKVAGDGMEGSKGSSPQKLKFTKLYHGTTKPASQSISKSGWRTDTNVTRQMQGSGVYTTPQKNVAQMYSRQRANQRGETPAVRTFAIPSQKFNQVKANREKSGSWTLSKGGNKFNIVQMSPKGANKYDITDKSKSAIDLKNTQRKELRQRVNTALSKPQNRKVLKKEINSAKPTRTIRGGGSSLQRIGSSSETTKRFQVGGGQGYGISGIKLAT